MRGRLLAIVMIAIAVLLMGAAKVNQLQDIGMGVSMKERLIAAPTSITLIKTNPTGLVYGPLPSKSKDGRLVYKVLLGEDGWTEIYAVISGRATNLLVGNYRPKWSAKSDTRTGNGSGGSQSSKPANPPAPPAKPWLTDSNLNGWELSGNFVQDTRGWFADNNPGTMTQGNSALRGTFQVSKSVAIFGEVAGSITQDRSGNWETTAFLGQNLAGVGGGLTALVLPRTTLSVGVRYFVDVPQGSGAVFSPNLFADLKGSTELKKGDGTLLIWDAKVSTNAFKDIGAKGEVTAKLHPNWGVSVLGVAKRYPSGNSEAQLGVGAKWYPTATESTSVGAYFMTPTTADAPPAAAATFQIKF